jgi:hypothetical protein
MSIRQYFLLSLLITPPFSAAIELTNEDLFFDASTVTLSISDQVKDGCLPKPQSLLAAAAAALRRNEFRIVDPDEAPPFTPDVHVTALGYEANEDCIVVFSMSIARNINAAVPNSESLPETYRRTTLLVDLTVYRSLLTGQREGMQAQLEREADMAGDDLFTAVDRAKNSVETNWPMLWEAYTSAPDD